MRFINEIDRRFFQDENGERKTKTLAGVVGVACCAILLATVPVHEGKRNVGYADPVGIPTACYGDTRDVVIGQFYSDTECKQRLNDQLIAHAEPVLSCTPEIATTTYQLAAAVSFAYNVGTGAYCSSTMAKKFRDGDMAGACAELSKWVYSKGEKLPGLVNRRSAERELCERGLQ